MASARFDVLGIGNAIVDVLARTEDDFLVKQGMNKGGMALIDEGRAQSIYDAMGSTVEISGGSAANTIVGIASLGSRGAFVGKVKDDELGRAFSHDIRAAGVAFTTPAATSGPSTGRCYVLVTPDGERTMNTFLGAAQDLHPSDIDEGVIASSAIIYLEGYLWDPKNAKDAFLKAAKIAHQSERKVALSLSDAFCVDRWRDEFLQLMRSGTVDLIFANEAELQSLYQTSDFDAAVKALREDIDIAVVTRSEKGCLVIGPDGNEAVSAFPVKKVVDTTGAGDLFAAGFLSGLARGADDRTCGRLGALAAGEVIQHLGARPEVSLKDLARDNGLLD
jgi:sugar/nucleoside kinase (ribokinase family)